MIKSLKQPNSKKIALLVGTLTVLITLIIGGFMFWQNSNDKSAAEILPRVDQLIDKLPKQSIDHPPIKLTSPKQPIPTNSWLSSLAFETKNISPTYAYPWIMQTTESGFSASYPKVKSSTDLVLAEPSSDIKLDFNSQTYKVSRFDDLSAKLHFTKQSQTIAELTITQGSPYLYLTLQPNQTAKLTFKGQVQKDKNDQIVLTNDQKRYGLWLDENLKFTKNDQTIKLTTANEPAKFSLITLDQSLDKALAFKLANNFVTKTSVTRHVNNLQAKTNFNVTTENDKPTLFGLLPHQYNHKNNLKSHGQIASIMGQQKFIKGNNFSYTLKNRQPETKLELKSLTKEQQTKLTQQLESDITETKFSAKDSYNAGKQLYRAANLLQLAHQLNEAELAKQIQTKLRDELSTWLEPNGANKRQAKYFYYDTQIKGLVGVEPGFGSQQFNDHHFHYGYFVYAAAILGRYDESFVDQNKAMISALIRDYASPKATDNFPTMRSFDAYLGYSLADGYGDTLDGNNQESSSEAVNAYYAIYLWSKTVNNQDLQNFSYWLYVNESNAALNYWTNIDLDAPQFKNYEHSIVALNWQGKLDYGTFFSDTPAAKLGIQLIPMSAGQTYLAKNPDRILKNLSATKGDVAQFADYLLMYQSLAKPEAALDKLDQIQPNDIDSANSKTYLMAWLFWQTM